MLEEFKVYFKEGIETDEIGQIKRDEAVFSLVECSDANENTPLSEASAGGASEESFSKFKI